MANAPAVAHRIALTAERVLAECEAAAPLILRMRWYLTAHWKRLCADVLNGRRRIRHFIYSLPLLAVELIWAARFAVAFRRKA